MRHIESTTEYRNIVSELYEQYGNETDVNARGVAEAHISSFTIHNHSITVTDGVEYEGASSPVLDEALDPYDVLRFSEALLPMRQPHNAEDTAAARAIEALTHDLNDH